MIIIVNFVVLLVNFFVVYSFDWYIKNLLVVFVDNPSGDRHSLQAVRLNVMR